MEIKPKHGIDKLVFGMQEPDVIHVYGKPNQSFEDEDGNRITTYNKHKMRLTFYADEGFRLGYLICADRDLTYSSISLIGRKCADVHKELRAIGLTKWTHENYDTIENWFNEDQWLILQTEFDEIVKVELGAMIERDEFDWKFKGK